MKPTILLISGIIAPTFYGPFWSYFSDIPKIFNQSNFNTFVIKLPAWGTIEERSKLIEHYINTHLKEKKFHVLAHSKGGIDYRFLVGQNQKIHQQTLSVTSLSCPYKGSRIASFYMSIPLLSLIKRIHITLSELTPQYLSNFWDNETDFEFKKFYIEVSIGKTSFFKNYPIFYFGNKYLNKVSDGFVTLESARWGEKIFSIKSDHIGVLGHFFNRFRKIKYQQMYRDIACHLKNL